MPLGGLGTSRAVERVAGCGPVSDSRLQLVRARDVVRSPWRNGLGTTRTFLTGPSVEDGAEPRWRVSLADIGGDGAFSAFPGLDRHFTVVDGDGVVLIVDGSEHRVGRLESLVFSGDAATDCRLVGSEVAALNVMTLRGRAQAQVRLVTDELTAPCASDEEVLVLDLDGGAVVEGATRLGQYDGVHAVGAGSLVVRPEGTVALVRLLEVPIGR